MNSIAILEGNINFLNVFLSNISTQTMLDENLKLFVIVESRIDEGNFKFNQFKDALSDVKFDCEIISSNEINDVVKSTLISNQFVDDYTMSMNILVPWYLIAYKGADKVLMLDDDVVLLPGFEKVFNFTNNAFYTHRLCAGQTNFEDESERRKKVYHEWFRLFDVEFSQEWWENVYLKQYINTGQWLISKDKFDINRFEFFIKKFFNSSVIYEEDWKVGKTHISGYIDEIFVTLFFLNSEKDSLNDITTLYFGMKNISKPSKNKVIIHYPASSHKYEVINWMIDNNIILGNKLEIVPLEKTKTGLKEIKVTSLW